MRRAGIQESNARTLRGRVQALERITYTKRRMMYLLCVVGAPKEVMRCERMNEKDRLIRRTEGQS